jgi:hypothetical protein
MLLVPVSENRSRIFLILKLFLRFCRDYFVLIVMDIPEYIFKSIFLLFMFQIVIQILMIIIRAITKQKRNLFLKWGRDLMGFADNAEDIGSGPQRLLFLWVSFLLAANTPSILLRIVVSLVSIAVVVIARVFIILRIYTEGKGLGVNFYYK